MSTIKQTLIQRTKDLVRMQTTADQTEELQRAVQYVDHFFRPQKRFVIHNYEKKAKPSIVIATQDTLTPDILMLGHLDVVPGSAELFEPREEDGKLYGRGVCDMKSEVAVMMELMNTIGQQENPPNIALMLTTDEEIGGELGAQYLIDEIGYRPKVALVPDSGRGPDEMVIWNKGLWHLEISAKGKTAHGSRPWEGENAIDKLIDAYIRIRELFGPSSTEDQWHDTCNIGKIRGGAATNQIADQATCNIDVRYVETTDGADLLAQIKDCAKECTVEVQTAGDASHTAPDHPYVKLYGETLQETLKLQAQPNKSCGGHDGRFLTAKGVPVIVSRPRSGGQHSPNEWLDLQSLEDFYHLYHKYIEKLAATF